MPEITNDMATISVSVNGKPYFGAWSTYDGGTLTATSQKTRRGGMGDEKSVGGPRTRANVTATIQFDDVVAGFHNELESLVGRTRCQVTIQFLNPDKTPIPGANFTRRGTLESVDLPKSDSNGDGSVQFYTLIMSCDAQAA